MPSEYQHLGPFSSLVSAAKRSHGLFPRLAPGPETQALVLGTLSFHPGPEKPAAVKVENRWEKDGLAGEHITWSVGYGPRTSAWLLRPAGVKTRLPGVVALHDHGGFKFFGKEKIAEGPERSSDVLLKFRADSYGGRPYANYLAREGFAVLVPDTFLWGSRKFPLETMPAYERSLARQAVGGAGTTPDEIAHYNATASLHEHLVEKYCRLLGTTLSGVISFEDRAAVNYLASRKDVLADSIGCVGLSGGGLRSGLLQATSKHIKAAVVVGLMSTYRELLDHNVASHTWMLYPDGWSRHGDWTDLVACRAPSPLLVQYDLDDQLFTRKGMRAADRSLRDHYTSVGAPDNYRGEFYPGPHKFDLAMQAAAFSWLRRQLAT